MDKKTKKKEITPLVKNIKKYRKKHNLTQFQLAVNSGVNYATITKIEIGVIKEPSVYICRDLARAFNISIEDLIGE